MRFRPARLIHRPSCCGAVSPASAAFRSVAHPHRTGEYDCGALGRETPHPLGLTTPRDGRAVNKAGSSSFSMAVSFPCGSMMPRAGAAAALLVFPAAAARAWLVAADLFRADRLSGRWRRRHAAVFQADRGVFDHGLVDDLVELFRRLLSFRRHRESRFGRVWTLCHTDRIRTYEVCHGNQGK